MTFNGPYLALYLKQQKKQTKHIEASVFKTLDISQQRTIDCKRWRTNEMRLNTYSVLVPWELLSLGPWRRNSGEAQWICYNEETELKV